MGLEEELRKVLPLRNGSEIKAEHGLQCLDELRGLLANERPHFDALLAIAQARKDGISYEKIKGTLDPESIKHLRFYRLIRPDGSIDKKIEDILWSSYQETSEGPVLTSPFKLTHAKEAKNLEDAEEEDKQKFIQGVREKIRRMEDGGRSP